MSPITSQAPPTVSTQQRVRAIAYVTKLVSRYEAELEAAPSTEAGVAHVAIVRRQLEDWRTRLDRLQRAA